MDKNIHILYIDDNPMDRALVRDSLEREHGGFILTEARSQIEFEKCIHDRLFDLVLTDFNILGYEGLEVLEKVKSVSPDTPVIVVTGTGSEEVAVKALKQGASDYVIKTAIHISRLPKTILSAIENRRVRSEKEKTQAELIKMNRVYAVISEINRMIVRTKKKDRLLQKTCEIAVDKGNFGFAWIGILNNDSGNISKIYAEGRANNYLSLIDLSPDFESKEAFNLSSLSDGKPLICNEVENCTLNAKWKKETLHQGFNSFLSIPFKFNSKKTGILNLYASQTNFFDEQEILFIKEIIDDISFALKSIQLESDRKLTNKKLVQAKQKAEESDKLKSAFLANMSHEIRTPMNGILGFSELLLEPELSSEEKEKYIQIVHHSGQRMLNTVSDIVEISKIEAGMVKVNFVEIDVTYQINELIHFFQLEAKKKGLKLTFESNLPTNFSTITTDPNKLDSILNNLIKNAIKYTDSGEINVGCSLKDSMIEFYVKDTGIGVPFNRQQAIFNRFEQADISNTRAFDGSGLGLAIVKSYLEMLGGNIWLESKESKGSTFYFSIPCQTETLEKLKKDKKEFSAPLKNKNQNLKILIAEDDVSSERLLSIIVSPYAKEIYKTTAGLETIEICQNNPDIDLILMDIQMPGINGYEATRQIRQFNKKVIIIAQTAFAIAGDRQKAIEAGCNDYISKPIKSEVLLELIGQYF